MIVQRHTVLLATLCLLPSLAQTKPLPKGDIIKLAKPATVLVDAKPAYGTAFCVQQDGYFITNAHVVAKLGARESVKLVLHAGEGTQKVVKASVVRKNTTLDLALLKAEEAGPFPSLPLGSVEKVTELDEMVAFGFPFGLALSKTEDYPAVTVHAASVSSLRRDKKRDLERIQLDGSASPGTSGGPVLDQHGTVVGVVVDGIRGSSIFLAIPVSHVQQFLERPEIALTVPAITPKERAEAREFRAAILAVPASKEPYDVALLIKSNNKERRFDMKLTNGSYVASAAAFEPIMGATRQVEVTFPEGKIQVALADQTFKLPMRDVTLNDIKTIRFGAKPQVVLTDGTTVDALPVELETLTANVGGQVLKIPTAGAKELTVQPLPAGANTYHVTVIVSRAGKEVGRAEAARNLDGTQHAVAGAVQASSFTRPAMALKPTTYGHIVSTPGDFIGQGKTYKYEADAIKVSADRGGVGVSVGDFRLTIAAQRGQALAVGEYLNATRFPFNKDGPGLSFSGQGRGSNRLTGRFVVWELEMANGTITRAAIDFVQYSEGNTSAPLTGVVRYNSTLE